MKTDLDVERLNSELTIVRPRNAVGTMGWSPKPWDVATINKGETPIRAFLRKNPNWTRSDIGEVLR